MTNLIIIKYIISDDKETTLSKKYCDENDFKGFNQYNENSLKPLYETGLAYQIQDDISDFLGIKDRGLPGRDLKEGKMNVLIMHYIENASPGEKFLLQEFLKKRFDSISEEEIQHWITQIQKKEGLERSIIHLDKVARKAIENVRRKGALE